MTTPQQNSTELFPIWLKHPDGYESLRFAPRCAGCGELVLDISESNIAVIRGGPLDKMERLGTHRGAQVFRQTGTARVFHWRCDAEQDEPNYPWENAAFTFRDRDETQPVQTPTRTARVRRSRKRSTRSSS